MESKKLRIISLALNLCLVACLFSAFFLPDYRLFLLFALVIFIVKAAIELSSQFIINGKTILVIILTSAFLILAAVGLYLFFFYFR